MCLIIFRTNNKTSVLIWLVVSFLFIYLTPFEVASYIMLSNRAAHELQAQIASAVRDIIARKMVSHARDQAEKIITEEAQEDNSAIYTPIEIALRAVSFAQVTGIIALRVSDLMPRESGGFGFEF
jgi:hypothetical protein